MSRDTEVHANLIKAREVYAKNPGAGRFYLPGCGAHCALGALGRAIGWGDDKLDSSPYVGIAIEAPGELYALAAAIDESLTPDAHRNALVTTVYVANDDQAPAGASMIVDSSRMLAAFDAAIAATAPQSSEEDSGRTHSDSSAVAQVMDSAAEAGVGEARDVREPQACEARRRREGNPAEVAVVA